MKKSYFRCLFSGVLVSLALLALYLVRSNGNRESIKTLSREPVGEVEPAKADLVINQSKAAARGGQLFLQRLLQGATDPVRMRLENDDTWYRLEAQAVLREFEAFRISSGMSDEKYVEFLGLVMDLRELGRAGGKKMRNGQFKDATERNLLLNKEAAPIRESIAELLGGETYGDYLRYVAAIPYVRVANSYISLMDQSGFMLSDDAAQRVTELYIEHYGLGDVRVNLTPDRLGWGVPIRTVQAALRKQNEADAEILQKASAFLDAAELKRLETHQQRSIALIVSAWKDRANKTNAP